MKSQDKDQVGSPAADDNSASLCHTILQSCERLKISRSYLYLLLEWSHIECIRVGSRTLIPDVQLQRFIAVLQLVERINRELAKKGEGHRVELRNSKHRAHGLYFILDESDHVISANVDLVALAQSFDVLRPVALDRAISTAIKAAA